MSALFEARGLSRSFGHVQALDKADFDVDAGEVVALIGDNGAGKSTMVKALTGNLDVDEGEMLFEGEPVHDHHARTRRPRGHGGGVPGPRARAAPQPGAEHVPRARDPPQGLARDGSGSWTRRRCAPRPRGILRTRSARCARSGRPVGAMSGGQRQRSRSSGRSPGPTRSYSWTSRRPRSVSCRPRTSWTPSSGSATRASPSCLISHSMPHVLEVADRIQVMRLGRPRGHLPADGHDRRRSSSAP